MLWNADGSRFGGSDVLDAGEIGLGPDNAPLTRIRNPSANRIQFNDDSTTFSLSDYFIVDEGQDGLITFQTIDGVVSFEVNGNVAASPNPNARRITFETPNALDTLLADLAVGDHLIFAVELPVPRHDLTLGETHPPFVGVVSLQKRAAPREAIQASANFPAFTTTATLLSTERLEGVRYIPIVHQRTVRPNKATCQPPVASVHCLPRILRSGRRLRKRTTGRVRHLPSGHRHAGRAPTPCTAPRGASVTHLPRVYAHGNAAKADRNHAATTYPAVTATVDVLTNNAIRHVVAGSLTFPAQTNAANVYQTERVDAAQTFNALTAAVTLQTRATARIPLTASQTFPAVSGTAFINQTEFLEASATYPAFVVTATLEQRTARRTELQASATFPHSPPVGWWSSGYR